MSKKLVSLISIFLALSVPTSHGDTYQLAIATDHVGGYERALFKLWIDADSNGCNTRAEVLIQEAIVKPTIGKNCVLTGGTWISPYDGVKVTKASALDIDHVVPLSEAWKSGAWAWTPAKRGAYANDLSNPRTLVAVSLGENRSKGDQDPAEWLPPKGVCTYISDWISIKSRYQLTVDSAEALVLSAKVKECKSSAVTVVFNTKVTAKKSPTPTGKAVFKFANCAAAKAAGVAPIRRATNPGLYEINAGLDRDKNGIACDT